MPHVLGPGFLSLQVRDLDASRRYYTEALGLTPAPQSPPGAVVFATRPIPFAIRAGLETTTPPGGGVAVWLACEDVDGLGERLGAVPQPGPFGRFVAVADPDGYALTLYQPPA